MRMDKEFAAYVAYIGMLRLQLQIVVGNRTCPALKEPAVSLINYEDTHGTGTLILSQWILTAPGCARKNMIKRYKVSAKMKGGTGIYTSNMEAIFTISVSDGEQKKIPSLHLVKLQRTVPECTRVTPIATRVDPFYHASCTIYASLPNLKLVALEAGIVFRDECSQIVENYSRRVMVCAETVPACYPPCGSSLVCDGRVLGVRDDATDCTGKYVPFLSVQYRDHAILRELSLREAGFVTPPSEGFKEQMIGSVYSSSRKRWEVNASSALFVTFVKLSLNVLNVSK